MGFMGCGMLLASSPAPGVYEKWTIRSYSCISKIYTRTAVPNRPRDYLFHEKPGKTWTYIWRSPWQSTGAGLKWTDITYSLVRSLGEGLSPCMLSQNPMNASNLGKKTRRVFCEMVASIVWTAACNSLLMPLVFGRIKSLGWFKLTAFLSLGWMKFLFGRLKEKIRDRARASAGLRHC
jgi:hypothetical protein